MSDRDRLYNPVGNFDKMPREITDSPAFHKLKFAEKELLRCILRSWFHASKGKTTADGRHIPFDPMYGIECTAIKLKYKPPLMPGRTIERGKDGLIRSGFIEHADEGSKHTRIRLIRDFLRVEFTLEDLKRIHTYNWPQTHKACEQGEFAGKKIVTRYNRRGYVGKAVAPDTLPELLAQVEAEYHQPIDPPETQVPAPEQPIVAPPSPPPPPQAKPQPNQPETNDMFLELWDAYPKKDDAKMAEDRRVFMELNPTPEEFAAIMDRLKAWKASEDWTKENGRYIPKFANFLKDDRWKTQPNSTAADAVQDGDLFAEREVPHLNLVMAEYRTRLNSGKGEGFALEFVVFNLSKEEYDEFVSLTGTQWSPLMYLSIAEYREWNWPRGMYEQYLAKGHKRIDLLELCYREDIDAGVPANPIEDKVFRICDLHRDPRIRWGEIAKLGAEAFYMHQEVSPNGPMPDDFYEKYIEAQGKMARHWSLAEYCRYLEDQEENGLPEIPMLQARYAKELGIPQTAKAS